MQSDLRQARHNLRGRLNALKLCVSAFDALDNRQEILEFLEMVEQAADRTAAALDIMEALQESSPEESSTPART